MMCISVGWFIFGLIVALCSGVGLGVLIVGLCMAASEADAWSEKAYQNLPKH